MPLHHVLRPEEFIDRQVIAAANLLDCVHATEHRIDDRGLARRGVQRLVFGGGNSSAAFLGPWRVIVLVVRHLQLTLPSRARWSTCRLKSCEFAPKN
jgi:hypothetical protein